ncbi:MAG: hypothetical protein DWQ10_17065 [Calditrichaeota bacterium]|nr:MAG: hypothetical protein DWQ10_17065 [Calditrichota bacterium]
MKKFHLMNSLVLTGLFLSLCFQPLKGQNPVSDPAATNHSKQKASLYYLGEQNELLIKVNIWGFVKKPGQYLVPTDTDLISLISYAGGPLDEAKLKKVKIIRNEVLLASAYQKQGSHYAMNGNTGVPATPGPGDQLSGKKMEKVLTIDVDKFLDSGNEDLIPELKPGDTIVIKGSTYHLFSKVIEFASKIAVFAQIYFWVEAAKN